MYYKQRLKKLWARIAVFAAGGILALALMIGTILKVTIYSASGTVLDGERSYSVSAGEAGQEAFLDAAVRKGMPELESADSAEFDSASGTVTVYRGVEVLVTDQGVPSTVTARRGATVEEALKDNGMALGPDDMVSPDRGLVITAKLTVDIKRCCHVNVSIDGSTQEVTLYGGTVLDALKEAGVKFSDDMACSESVDAPLEDGMELTVTRLAAFTVTADGKTSSYKISPGTVGEALERCGYNLGEDDRLNVPEDRRLTSGMRIVIQRVEIVEETETEEIDYGVQYVSSSDLPQGETQLLSAGLKGEKELVYRATYVDGKLEDRELLSEEVKDRKSVV